MFTSFLPHASSLVTVFYLGWIGLLGASKPQKSKIPKDAIFKGSYLFQNHHFYFGYSAVSFRDGIGDYLFRMICRGSRREHARSVTYITYNCFLDAPKISPTWHTWQNNPISYQPWFLTTYHSWDDPPSICQPPWQKIWHKNFSKFSNVNYC